MGEEFFIYANACRKVVASMLSVMKNEYLLKEAEVAVNKCVVLLSLLKENGNWACE